MRHLLAFLLLIFAAQAARAAAPEIEAVIKTIESEAKCFGSPGPDPGETRPICVWWPQKSTVTPLPTLYMMDGMVGLEIALIDLKPALDAGTVAPMMIVATNAKTDGTARAEEYVKGLSDVHFDRHAEWLMKTVMPWAEKNMKASPERAKRFIGGFSNGADLALALATKHPDVFGGALLHSPAVATRGWIGDQAGSQRWVITGGTEEIGGSIRKPAILQKDIAWALEKHGAPVRVCIGRWSHQGKYWRQLSAGSLTWLLQLGNFDVVGSPLEHGNCKNSP